MNKKYEINMTEGNLFGKLILYAIPLMLSSMLQLLFNAVDVIVVGKCVDETALAAVGSTGSLVNLMVGLFTGLSVGTNVLVAKAYGAGREKDAEEVNHTSILLGIIFGVLLGIIGFLFAHTFLSWMGSPDDVIGQATVYLKIYFLGMPFTMVYNFASASLRAVGDTRRPLYFLTISGVVNLFLNLFLVIAVHLGVAGVAIATVVSQALSCILVLRCLRKSEGGIHFDVRKLRIVPDKLSAILRIGLPAGLQGTVFSISNVLIQSSINSFGSLVMAGNTAASNIEGFVYMAMNAMYQANISFTSQNVGAGNLKRVKKVMVSCLLLVSLIGIVLGVSAYLLSPVLLKLYTDSAEAIQYARIRMRYVCLIYFTCGIMDTLVGSLRGIGSSVIPMITSLLGSCAFRVIWIYTYFRSHRTLDALYVSYPISWVLTASAHFICFLILFRALKKRVGSIN